MSLNTQLLKSYASSPDWRSAPACLQALGEITDPEGKKLLSMAFTTSRDIITQIGYSPSSHCPEALCACAAVLCELSIGKAVMAAQLLGPSEILGKLTDDGKAEDSFYYYSLLATLALKNALSSYASYRSGSQKSQEGGQP